MDTFNPRTLQVFKELVEYYIQQGAPVGSNVLARESELTLSSATIRHIMAELEEADYLYSPHTSSGRIPTTKGYRLYVDNFVQVTPPTDSALAQVERSLMSSEDHAEAIGCASRILSGMTNLTGVVTLPVQDKLVIQQIEFLSLSPKRVLVVLVFADGSVQNRVIHLDQSYTKSELEKAGNFLTAQIQGDDIISVQSRIADSMRNDKAHIDEMMQAVMTMMQDAQEQNSDQYVVAGESNLISSDMGVDSRRLKALFDAFSQKQTVLHLLTQTLKAKGIKIYIGEESGIEIFDSCGVVTAPYTVDGQVVGVLGVIGPRRMPYHAVSTTVDMTAKVLSQALATSQLE